MNLHYIENLNGRKPNRILEEGGGRGKKEQEVKGERRWEGEIGGRKGRRGRVGKDTRK